MFSPEPAVDGGSSSPTLTGQTGSAMGCRVVLGGTMPVLGPPRANCGGQSCSRRAEHISPLRWGQDHEVSVTEQYERCPVGTETHQTPQTCCELPPYPGCTRWVPMVLLPRDLGPEKGSEAAEGTGANVQ